MAQGYRLEITSPQTKTLAERAWAWEPSDERVNSIVVELKKDKHRVNQLVASIYDPGWEIFNQLPDIAFWDIPCRLLMAPIGNPNSVSNLVFDGKVTGYKVGYPGPESFAIVAHDNAIDMRRQKRYRIFKGLTSVQLAKKIAE